MTINELSSRNSSSILIHPFRHDILCIIERKIKTLININQQMLSVHGLIQILRTNLQKMLKCWNSSISVCSCVQYRIKSWHKITWVLQPFYQLLQKQKPPLKLKSTLNFFIVNTIVYVCPYLFVCLSESEFVSC